MDQDRMLAELFSALGHPNRLRIIAFLRDGERCQCELPDALQLEQSNVSRHVKQLVTAGLLVARKDGTKTMVRVSNPAIFDLVDDAQSTILERLKRRLEAMNI